MFLQDQLASEMFQLMSREAELAHTIVEYARLQRTYHEKALSVLDNFLPDLETVVCKCFLLFILCHLKAILVLSILF